MHNPNKNLILSHLKEIGQLFTQNMATLSLVILIKLTPALKTH